MALALIRSCISGSVCCQTREDKKELDVLSDPESETRFRVIVHVNHLLPISYDAVKAENTCGLKVAQIYRDLEAIQEMFQQGRQNREKGLVGATEGRDGHPIERIGAQNAQSEDAVELTDAKLKELGELFDGTNATSLQKSVAIAAAQVGQADPKAIVATPAREIFLGDDLLSRSILTRRLAANALCLGLLAKPLKFRKTAETVTVHFYLFHELTSLKKELENIVPQLPDDNGLTPILSANAAELAKGIGEILNDSDIVHARGYGL